MPKPRSEVAVSTIMLYTIVSSRHHRPNQHDIRLARPPLSTRTANGHQHVRQVLCVQDLGKKTAIFDTFKVCLLYQSLQLH